MSDLIFIATRSMVFVPTVTLMLLLSLIWLKASDNKLRLSAVWLVSYVAVCGVLLSVAYVQYLSDCGFGLRDCYSNSAPDWLWTAKLLAVVAYWIWFVFAGVSVIRRVFRVFEK